MAESKFFMMGTFLEKKRVGIKMDRQYGDICNITLNPLRKEEEVLEMS